MADVRAVLAAGGRTFAAEAAITLRNKPAPLFQLAVLTTLLSKPIDADMAASAAAELFRAGWRTPARMAASSWQARVDALGRAHYRRFDESSATRVDELAGWVTGSWHGDLRRLAAAADGDADTASGLLHEAPGIGPLGAAIFLREAQAVWPWLRPYADERMLAAAADLGLPTTAAALARAAGTDDLSLLGAAVVRVQHDPGLLA